MASQYQNLIDAVLSGMTVRVAQADVSQSALRVALWRAFREVQKLQRELGIQRNEVSVISILPEGDDFVVKLCKPKTRQVSFIILDEVQDGSEES